MEVIQEKKVLINDSCFFFANAQADPLDSFDPRFTIVTLQRQGREKYKTSFGIVHFNFCSHACIQRAFFFHVDGAFGWQRRDKEKNHEIKIPEAKFGVNQCILFILLPFQHSGYHIRTPSTHPSY